jgi:hypothetical protein
MIPDLSRVKWHFTETVKSLTTVASCVKLHRAALMRFRGVETLIKYEKQL